MPSALCLVLIQDYCYSGNSGQGGYHPCQHGFWLRGVQLLRLHLRCRAPSRLAAARWREPTEAWRLFRPQPSHRLLTTRAVETRSWNGRIGAAFLPSCCVSSRIAGF